MESSISVILFQLFHLLLNGVIGCCLSCHGRWRLGRIGSRLSCQLGLGVDAMAASKYFLPDNQRRSSLVGTMAGTCFDGGSKRWTHEMCACENCPLAEEGKNRLKLVCNCNSMAPKVFCCSSQCDLLKQKKNLLLSRVQSVPGQKKWVHHRFGCETKTFCLKCKLRLARQHFHVGKIDLPHPFTLNFVR